MKHIIKQQILVLPYNLRKKFLKRFSLRNSMVDALQHLIDKGYYPNIIIDVGAAKGTYPLLNKFKKSFFIWIEPLVEFEKGLKRLKKAYKGDYIIAAAGKISGKGIINVHDDLYGSSLLKEKDGKIADGIQREINMINIDSIIEKYNITEGSKVFLKLDVQGFELEVLEGAFRMLQYCEAVMLEVSFFNFQESAPDFYDIVQYMKKCGFVAYDIINGLNRPLDNALAQKDILFVKEKGIFRQSHKFIGNP